MKILKYVSLLSIAFVFFVSCSGDYGKLKLQNDTEEKMTLAELRKNWEDYHVYWCTRAYHSPVAIMFDPKNDEPRIVGDNWIKIADQQTLSETTSIFQNQYDSAKVEIIEGSDKRFFGYMYYYPRLYITVEMIDERTLYVSSMPGHGSAP